MTVGGYMLPTRKGTTIGAIGLDITMKTNGDSTQGAYSLFEYSIPPGVDGPPPHLHTREDESFICLGGRLAVQLGDENFEMAYGDYLLLPRHVVHAFRNPFDEEARIISVVSPAGLERYYQALAEMPPGKRDMSKMMSIMEDFGIELKLPTSPS